MTDAISRHGEDTAAARCTRCPSLRSKRWPTRCIAGAPRAFGYLPASVDSLRPISQPAPSRTMVNSDATIDISAPPSFQVVMKL